MQFPQIHPSARVMSGAVIEGRVTIGPNSFIGAGAIITANNGTISIGSNTVIMEQAIVRSAPRFPCNIGDHVLIGPKACITGAAIHNACFIATNATVFHGAELESGTVVAVNGVVHIGTHCPAETFVPIQHIAFGNPARIYSPSEISDFHTELNKLGFAKYVYGINTTGLSRASIYTQLTEKFLADISADHSTLAEGLEYQL